MIAITGATGLVGTALVDLLLSARVPLRLAVRSRVRTDKAISAWKAAGGAINIVECDFENANDDQIRAVVDGCSTVVHLAGRVHDPRGSTDSHDLLNFTTTKKLACEAGRAGVSRFLYSSTIAVYGSRSFVDLCETAQARPDTAYGVSKWKAEQYLQSELPVPTTVILRPSLVFGEGDRGNMLSLIRQVLRGRYFHIGAGQARKSLIYARDLARAVVLCLERCPAGISVFNAANPDSPTMRDIADTIARAGRVKSPIPTVPEPLVRAASYASVLLNGLSPLPPAKLDKLTRSNTVSVRALQEATGFAPEFSLLEAIEAEINWGRSSGLIA